MEHCWFGRLQRGRQGGHSLAKQLHWPARNLDHEWHHVSILCQVVIRRDIMEHCWFGRLQRGRQGGHSLAKQLHWPARDLAHEWHHVSILCQFANGRDIVEHQKLLTDSAINRHCFDRLRIVFPQLNQSIHRITTPSGTPTNTTRQPASPHGSRAVASLISWD